MLRLLTAVFVLITLGAFMRDLLVSIEAGAWAPVALGQWWFEIHPNSLQLLQPAIERHVSPALWDPHVLGLLEGPLIYTSGILAVCFWILSLFFKRKRRVSMSHQARF
ncbi:MAG: hypothetical protein AAF675_19335 [Pseudomonadota bacterium]